MKPMHHRITSLASFVIVIIATLLGVSMAPTLSAQTKQVTAVTVQMDGVSKLTHSTVQAKFTGKITTKGPCKVTYRWKRSDGVAESTKSFTATTAGTQTVTNSWELDYAHAGSKFWQVLEVLTPNALASSEASFTVPARPANSPDFNKPAFKVESVVTKQPKSARQSETLCNYEFQGTITTNGPGTVTYRWKRSDGWTGPVKQLVATKAAAHPVASDVWPVTLTKEEQNLWQAIEVLTPVSLMSNQVSFKPIVLPLFVYLERATVHLKGMYGGTREAIPDVHVRVMLGDEMLAGGIVGKPTKPLKETDTTFTIPIKTKRAITEKERWSSDIKVGIAISLPPVSDPHYSSLSTTWGFNATVVLYYTNGVERSMTSTYHRYLSTYSGITTAYLDIAGPPTSIKEADALASQAFDRVNGPYPSSSGGSKSASSKNSSSSSSGSAAVEKKIVKLSFRKATTKDHYGNPFNLPNPVNVNRWVPSTYNSLPSGYVVESVKNTSLYYIEIFDVVVADKTTNPWRYALIHLGNFLPDQVTTKLAGRERETFGEIGIYSVLKTHPAPELELTLRKK